MPDRTEREIGHAEGVLQQRLDQYDRHFADINGSQAETVSELRALSVKLDAVAAAQLTAEKLAVAVAVALAKKEADGFTTRGKAAWGIGLLVSVLVIAGSVKALLGL